MQRLFSTYSDTDLYYALAEEGAQREAAFAELYTRYSSRIFLYCRRVLGDTPQAEDVFQETFLRFLNSVDVNRKMTNVPAYLLRIARNLCLNAKRSKKHNIVAFEDFNYPVHNNAYEREELTQLVATALDLLSEEYREAFVLQAYNGLSYAEIAEVVGVPLTTVRNRVVRAKKKIQQILTPYLEDLQQK